MATEKVTLTLTKGMSKKLDQLAAKENRSRSKYVDIVLIKHLKGIFVKKK